MYASLALESGTKGEYIGKTLNFVFRHVFSLLEFHITNSTTGTLVLEGLTLDGGTVAVAGDYTFDLKTSVLTSGKTADASELRSKEVRAMSSDLLLRGESSWQPELPPKSTC